MTAVSYLNTKPFLYGIFNKGLDKQLDIELNIPSRCASLLKSGAVDLGLVPVAIIPELDNPYLISDYCIGTKGAVQTVCIYSEQPIEKVERLFLDYHSRTSVELTKILLKSYWHCQPEFIHTYPGYELDIKGNTAGLIIGDRTIGLDQRFPYVYDLGEIWHQYTGLPFVFAAWVANKELSPDFVTAFNEALKAGLAHIPQLIYLIPPPSPEFDLEHYFTHHISYELDAPKRQALSRFLEALGAQLPPSAAGAKLVQ